MMPKCCEKCARKHKDNCASFKDCEAWRSWFREQWDAIKAAAQKTEENRAKSSSTNSLCLYTTDPCGAMAYKRGGAGNDQGTAESL